MKLALHVALADAFIEEAVNYTLSVSASVFLPSLDPDRMTDAPTSARIQPQLSTTPSSLVFALVRDLPSSPSLTTLVTTNSNVYIMSGDLDSLSSLHDPSLAAASTS